MGETQWNKLDHGQWPHMEWPEGYDTVPGLMWNDSSLPKWRCAFCKEIIPEQYLGLASSWDHCTPCPKELCKARFILTYPGGL